MMIKVYLDNNATTRPHSEAIAAMRTYEDELYLNASSIAGELLGAAAPISEARIALGSLLGVSDEDCIAVTSGATESNAWVFFSTPQGAHIVSSAVEHSSILAAIVEARRRGHRVDFVGVDRDGLIDPDQLAAVIRPDTHLVSLQLANNETGVIQSLPELSRIVRHIAPRALIHTDATQALGRIEIDLSRDLKEIDLLSFSAHKFHGPKGIGGLFIRNGVRLTPLIPGEQEGGLRGGTFNVPAVAGMAVAARMARSNLASMSNVEFLRNSLEQHLRKLGHSAYVNGDAAHRLPNTPSFCFPGLHADHVVEQLALQGICIATGSACTAGATAPSHVLKAMQLTDADAQSTLRFSLSSETSATDIQDMIAALAHLLIDPTSFVDHGSAPVNAAC